MIYSKYPELPAPLPQRIRLPNGLTRTSLHELSNEELLELGFYPVTEIRPILSANQAYGTPSLVLENNIVTATYPVIDLPPPKITVTAWQIRKALNAANLRTQVEAAVAASTDQDLKDGWEYALTFESDNPLILTLCEALNISDEQRLQIFEAAART
jgi:hypothetical protein